MNHPTGSARAGLRRSLLSWYDRSRRDLPWRRDPSPYRVVLSEFLLQQTRVDTVVPYFERFVERFPSIESLASAPLDDVLKCWEGLGYYARARNLHAAAREIVERHEGKVPDRADDLSNLKGFGPYTTAAVASIAFDLPHAVVDGNVIRVLSRLCAIKDDVARADVRTRIAEIAQDLLDPVRPGDANQAAMELGATLCSPRNPDCPQCPIARHCRGRKLGIQTDLPVKSKRGSRQKRTEVAVVLRRNTSVLVAKRPEEGLLGGLWEFPTVPVQSNQGKKDWGNALSDRTGLNVSIEGRLQTLHHAFTHFELELKAYEGQATGKKLRPTGYTEIRWAKEADLDRLAFSRVHRRLADYIAMPHQLELTSV